jgi:hypothetical protein
MTDICFSSGFDERFDAYGNFVTLGLAAAAGLIRRRAGADVD